MGIIRIAICDDELFFAEKLKKIIASYCGIKQIPHEVDIYQSGREFLFDNEKMLGYQIVFLDINMDEMDGLETARKLRKFDNETFLIFVTAFINYTIEGYKVDAIRYVLKTDPNFEASVLESLDAVFEKMAYTPKIENFCFREGEKNIALEKIIYIESNLHKLTFHVYDKEICRYTIYETLNKISELFSEDFVRIHQSYLVNLRFIRTIEGNKLILSNGTTLLIARSKQKEVCKRVAMFKGEL